MVGAAVEIPPSGLLRTLAISRRWLVGLKSDTSPVLFPRNITGS